MIKMGKYGRDEKGVFVWGSDWEDVGAFMDLMDEKMDVDMSRNIKGKGWCTIWK